jgi:hypothetical protein
VLLKEYIKGEARYWVSDPKKRSTIAVPVKEGKQLEESFLIEPHDPGLFEDCSQSFVIRRRGA